MPVFVLDPRLLGGRFPSPNRAWFLDGCLAELRDALRERGGELVIREGRPERSSRSSPARSAPPRSTSPPTCRRSPPPATAGWRRRSTSRCAAPGLFVADVGRREAPSFGLEPVPPRLGAARSPRGPRRARRAERPERRSPSAPPGLSRPEAAALPARGAAAPGARDRLARRRPRALRGAPRPVAGGTSQLSPYLHFGCISPRELEERALERGGGARLRPPARVARLLRPRPPQQPRQHARGPQGEATLEWDEDQELLDAGARAAPATRSSTPRCASCSTRLDAQPRAADRRLVPDQGPALDWRAGRGALHAPPAGRRRGLQQRQLAVDRVGRRRPAPYFRRMYNPRTQQRRHDPDGEYVRRWLPELRDVPLEARRAVDDERRRAGRGGLRIGEDYPEPVVDHKEERGARWRATARWVRTAKVRARRGPSSTSSATSRPASRRSS